MGSYYANDVSAPLLEPLKRDFKISDVTYNNLFWSSYSYSGMFWPLIGGLLADRYGQAKLFIFNAVMVVIGVGIMTLGVYNLESW